MNLQSYIADFITVVNDIVIPFILGIAFLFFVINAIRFFVIGGATDEGKEKSKQLAVYGVAAFVFILLFWGLVNLFTSSLGLERIGEITSRCSDYGPEECGTITVDSTGEDTRVGFWNNIGDPRPPSLGGGGGLGNPPSISVPNVTDTPIILGQSARPGEPLINRDAFPVLNRDIIEAAADAAATRETVSTITSDFTSNLGDTYNDRIQPVIAEAVSAINDTSATNEERAIAAIRLSNYNQMTENDLVRYIAILNVGQTVNSQPALDVSALRTQATRPSTDLLQQQIDFTKDALRPLFAKSNQSFFDWGQPNAAAEQAGLANMASIYQLPPNAARVVAFDNLVAEGNFPSGSVMPRLRTSLIGDINGERFFQGLPPLAETTPSNCTGNGPC